MINSSNSNLLSIIRERSRQWHKSIDEIGVSHAIRSGEFNRFQYHAWLCHSLSFSKYLLRQVAQKPDAYAPYSNHLPRQIDIDRMVSDIPAEYIPHIADIDTSGPLMPPIIPVYIYVGSSMGRSMIGRIVHKQMPSESASYISASDEKVDMKKFVAEANTLITNIDDRDLYDAVDAMWQAIISNYKYYLGLSPL